MEVTWPEVALASIFLLCLTALFAWVTLWNVFRAITKHAINKAVECGGDIEIGGKK